MLTLLGEHAAKVSIQLITILRLHAKHCDNTLVKHKYSILRTWAEKGTVVTDTAAELPCPHRERTCKSRIRLGSHWRVDNT